MVGGSVSRACLVRESAAYFGRDPLGTRLVSLSFLSTHVPGSPILPLHGGRHWDSAFPEESLLLHLYLPSYLLIMMTMNFEPFTAISFDCYGTLIDWEAGIVPVVRALLAGHGQSLPAADILELYGEFEAEAESGPYQSYREVLQSVVRAFADRFHFEANSSEIRSLYQSVPAWMPFPDTVSALRELQKRHKLAVISNIDDNLFAETRKRLGVEFDAVITAEQARSYKPSLNNFQIALRMLSISADRLLHAAQSIYHDIVPAQSLGIATAWVNRKSARPGIGAVRDSPQGASGKRADVELPDLASLAATVLKRA
jgi:2-haloacid dehalogenase